MPVQMVAGDRLTDEEIERRMHSESKKKMDLLAKLEYDWDQRGSRAIAIPDLNLADSLVVYIGLDCQPQAIYPLSGGRILMEWRTSNHVIRLIVHDMQVDWVRYINWGKPDQNLQTGHDIQPAEARTLVHEILRHGS